MLMSEDGENTNSICPAEEVWTVEDEAVYGPLRRKKLRIEARLRRDRARQRRFSTRIRKK